jgi:hypothetical protein
MLAQVWSDNTALAKQATLDQGGELSFAAVCTSNRSADEATKPPI